MMKTGAVLRLLSVVVVFAVSTFLFTSVLTADISDISHDILAVNPVKVQYGDVNGDGAVTVKDVRAVLKYIQNKEELSGDSLRAADADLDCAVTMADAAKILKNADVSDAVGLFEQNGVQAVWVSIDDGDFPSKTGLTEAELRAEIAEIVNTVKELGLNTIYLQVRACSDALYPSDIFPSSAYITGKQGDELPLDILEAFIKEAHDAGLSLYAWISPCLVSSLNDIGALSDDNPAVLHKEYTVSHTDENGKSVGIWYNIGLSEVRQMIVDGVMEIVKYYDIDGILLDDGFYPDENTENFDDKDAFEKYGNGLSSDEWREQNVNALIRDAYTSVKAFKPEISFGVSSTGVLAEQDDTQTVGDSAEFNMTGYADAVTWIENGWVDYVVPLLYTSVTDSSAPFVTLANMWSALCNRYNVSLQFGLAAYKGNEFEDTELMCQLLVLEDTLTCDGVAYFSYKSLKNNTGNIEQVLAMYEAPASGFDETIEVGEIGQA